MNANDFGTKLLGALDRAISAPKNSADWDGGAANTQPMPPPPPAEPEAPAPARPARGSKARPVPMERVRVKQPSVDLLANVPFPSPSQEARISTLLEGRGLKQPAKALAELRKLDPAYARLQKAISEAARPQGDAYRAHLADIAARVAAGDATASEADAWSREDFIADARERMTAFKAELTKIEVSAWAIAEPVLIERGEFALRVADELEEAARVPFEQFEVPFTIPAYVLLVRKYAHSLSNGSRRNGGLPSSLI